MLEKQALIEELTNNLKANGGDLKTACEVYALAKAFEMYPDVKVWKLETILQEPLNCHLYEKCGFRRVGEEHVVNERMTLIDYEFLT